MVLISMSRDMLSDTGGNFCKMQVISDESPCTTWGVSVCARTCAPVCA